MLVYQVISLPTEKEGFHSTLTAPLICDLTQQKASLHGGLLADFDQKRSQTLFMNLEKNDTAAESRDVLCRPGNASQ
jgi:hypothetical protein